MRLASALAGAAPNEVLQPSEGGVVLDQDTDLEELKRRAAGLKERGWEPGEPRPLRGG